MDNPCLTSLTDEELLVRVYASCGRSELELELACRLGRALDALADVSTTFAESDGDIDETDLNFDGRDA